MKNEINILKVKSARVSLVIFKGHTEKKKLLLLIFKIYRSLMVMALWSAIETALKYSTRRIYEYKEYSLTILYS